MGRSSDLGIEGIRVLQRTGSNVSGWVEWNHWKYVQPSLSLHRADRAVGEKRQKQHLGLRYNLVEGHLGAVAAAADNGCITVAEMRKPRRGLS